MSAGLAECTATAEHSVAAEQLTSAPCTSVELRRRGCASVGREGCSFCCRQPQAVGQQCIRGYAEQSLRLRIAYA